MKVSEVKTAFEERKAFVFKRNGKDAIARKVKVQHLGENLYKGENSYEEGDTYFDLFIFFDDVPIGMIQTYLNTPEKIEINDLLDDVHKKGLSSKESFISALDKKVEEGIFISNVQIAMAEQIAADRVEKYKKAREDFYVRREEKERIRQREILRQELAARNLKIEELEAKKAEFLGWDKELPYLRFVRAASILDKYVRYETRIMPAYKFIKELCLRGYAPKKEENVITYYGSRWNPKQSKPKTVYSLALPNGEAYNINKTEYDFACYLERIGFGKENNA